MNKAKRAELRKKAEKEQKDRKMNRLGVSSLPEKKKHIAKSKRKK